MICALCDKSFKSLGSHLKHSHSIADLKDYYDAFIKRENEGVCEKCGETTTFRGLSKGYLRFCSLKCSCSSAETILKRKVTSKKNFGDENFRNTEKSRKTRLEKYGKFNSDECRKKSSKTKRLRTESEIEEANEKSRATRMKRYGKWRTDESAERIRETKLKRYGNLNNHEKAVKTRIERYGRPSPPSPSNGISEGEKELLQFIRSIYAGEVIEGDRITLDGKEIDILIPERKLGIEFDGLWWHSSLFKEKDYHLKKTLECEKKGVRLVHVFEDEWRTRRKAVEKSL